MRSGPVAPCLVIPLLHGTILTGDDLWLVTNSFLWRCSSLFQTMEKGVSPSDSLENPPDRSKVQIPTLNQARRNEIYTSFPPPAIYTLSLVYQCG